ncbi:ATP synthase F1 subunit gamma [Candidatus Uhrbacteria bacterium CG10_big_fil_rev_8_21_14_0_10_48_11]|uniref:ATP synthase gamma chain n=1 Tax=Candidatus Uhrbacteria bacterium CG10_big_fil_rev_8_21_14_0_10_48_11 TaxID=1975037 RepID=A0A2M8LF27_9BACT|nr:MAG: ATP synthase F1 subunit gamma [Candidatus Uhrbacteria bacterium CG10_big_fil_rev_8_21_14_0_10_48_11]
MAGSTRELKRRVRGVTSIRQITRAMELVSAAKMQRAVNAVTQSRRYAALAWDMLTSVTAKLGGKSHLLLSLRPRRHAMLIVLSSNNGLAGGYNTKVAEVARAYEKTVREGSPEATVEVVTLGKKGRDYLVKRGSKLAAEFERNDRESIVSQISPITELAMSGYVDETYDEVAVAYTDFVSTLKQEPRVRRLLPVATADETLGHTAHEYAEETVASAETVHTFEPDVATVLDRLVPRLIEVQLYQALQESNASEHAARMMAMRNASDAAKDLKEDLTLTLNQLRQSGITSELAEISAGRMALGA